MNSSTIRVHPQRVAIVSCKVPHSNALVTIQHRGELTQVVPEEVVIASNVHKIENGWRWLTFDFDIPLSMVGFFARVTTALAHAGVGVDIYSAFSTDHLLIREKDMSAATHALEGLGYKVVKD